jgi:hypothetical protein
MKGTNGTICGNADEPLVSTAIGNSYGKVQVKEGVEQLGERELGKYVKLDGDRIK